MVARLGLAARAAGHEDDSEQPSDGGERDEEHGDQGGEKHNAHEPTLT
jgi:hypothetical protein